jgi:hypothetical protein
MASAALTYAAMSLSSWQASLSTSSRFQ